MLKEGSPKITLAVPLIINNDLRLFDNHNDLKLLYAKC